MDRLFREWTRIRSSSLLRNAGWMFAGQLLSVACQGIYFVLLARLLGVVQYGIYAGALSMIMMVAQYCTLGSHSIFLRYVGGDPTRHAKYWGNVLLTTLSIGTLMTLFVVTFGPFVAHAYARSMLAWTAIANCLCLQLSLAAGRVFQTFEKMRMTALLNLLTNLLRAIAVAILVLGWHRATAGQWAFAAMLVSLVVAIVAIKAVERQYGHANYSLRLARDRAAEGLVFSVSYSTTGVCNDIDKAMLGHYGMDAANGVYTMAYRAVDICTAPLFAIQAAAFPRFFKTGDAAGIEGTKAYAIRIVTRTAASCIFLAILMFIFAPLIPRIVGHGFHESVEALRWLCLLPLLRSFHIAAGDALSGAGRQHLRLSSQSLAAAFNFGANLYLIPHYGWRGASWSSLATDGGLAAVNWAILLIISYRARRRHMSDSLSAFQIDVLSCEKTGGV